MAEQESFERLNADEVRKRMREIRQRMSGEATQVADDAKLLTDWRFYVRQFPGAVLATCACVGYLIVPPRRKTFTPDEKTLRKLAAENKLVFRGGPSQKPGLTDSLLALAGNAAARAALAYARQHVGKAFQDRSHGTPMEEAHP